jgi:hypothetical protein
MIDGFAVGMPLVYLDRGETLARDRGTQHHALRYPITGEKAVDHGLKRPAFSPCGLRRTGKDFPRRTVDALP